jgi:zinc transport system substrate-binding protein
MKPNKFIVILIVFLVFIFGAIYFFSVNKKVPFFSDKPKIAASIFPLYDITKNIAGGELEVVLILPPGASPHTFDPSPKEVRALSGSVILFAIGHGLDNWAFKLGESAGISEIYLVDKGIDLLDFEEDEDEDENNDEHEEYENDPHYWLTVGNALIIAEQVKDELSNRFPEKNDVFEENFENYSKKLQDLDQKMKTKLTTLNNPSIGTFHNAWSYFARDYPVTIAAVFEEFPGREPTAKYISGFQEKVRSNNVRVIFAEPQFSPIALEPIAGDLSVKLSTLDPLGGAEGRDTYEALMLYNVNQIIKAFE